MVDDWILAHISTDEDAVTNVGLDCEWHPWPRNRERTVATIQLATSSAAIVAHVSHLHFAETGSAGSHDGGVSGVDAGASTPVPPLPPGLLRVLASPQIQMVGCAVEDDIQRIWHAFSLHARLGLPHSPGEILHMAGDRGFTGKKNLQFLATTLLGWPKWKSWRLTMSQWERFPLSSAQVVYAAMDAAASLTVYDMLHSMPRMSAPYATTAVVAVDEYGIEVAAAASAAAPLPSASSLLSAGGVGGAVEEVVVVAAASLASEEASASASVVALGSIPFTVDVPLMQQQPPPAPLSLGHTDNLASSPLLPSTANTDATLSLFDLATTAAAELVAAPHAHAASAASSAFLKDVTTAAAAAAVSRRAGDSSHLATDGAQPGSMGIHRSLSSPAGP